MRRSLLTFALLATTALTPVEAKADPVNGFVLGALGVAGGSAIAATAAYTAGVAFASSIVGGFVVKTVLAIGLSALAAKLAGKPSVPPPGARMVNFAQGPAYAEYVWGRTRKGGPLGFTGFNNSRRYYVPILAAHPIEGIVEHWLDERTAILTAEADTNLSNISTAPMAGYGRIDPFTGTEPANAGLVAAFTEITSDYDFKGLSGAVIWAKRPPESSFTEIYPGGREWAYAPVIDGKNDVYDPRTETTGFTRNAALNTADWIVNVLGREVDWDEVAGEADVCDETVTNAEGGTQPRWRLDGSVSDEQDYEDQRAQIAAAADTFIYERPDGKVGFMVGRYEEPTLVLGPDDFFAFEVSEGQWGADAPDEVSVFYTEPENAWRETPAGIWVERETSRPVKDEPRIYMISNHNQASRVGKRVARVKRAKYQLQGTLGFAGYELLGGRDGRAHRFFRFVHPEMGIDEVFEVGELARESLGIFSVTANSTKVEDFEFDALTEEPERPAYGNNVASDGAIPAPDGLSGGALAQGSLLFVWDEQDAAYTQELRYRKVGETEWLGASTKTSSDRLQVAPFEDGADVEAQIRNISSGAGVSAWAPDTPVVVSAVVNPNAPGDITDFDVQDSGGSSAIVSFTAPNDANYFGTRIWRGTTSTFGSAALVHTEYGIPSDGDSFTDTGAGAGTYYFWAAPINSSGIEGTLAGPRSVFISTPGP